jgi:hypothetical protein
MSHKTIHLLCAIFGLILLSACKKDSAEKSPLIGKVMLINSDTPVDRALVRFIRAESNGLFNPLSYYIQQEIITGPDGKFTIPDTTTADYIQAWGLNSIYDGDPSVEVYLYNYLANGGIPKLYLKPPAWLKIKAVDVEPLNPEISHVYLDTLPGNFESGWTLISNQTLKWRIHGNVIFPLRIMKYSTAIDDYEYTYPELSPIAPFDTTEYIFEY